MTTYKALVKHAAQVEGNILKNLLKKYRISLDQEINIKNWGEIYKNTEYKKSHLSLERQVQILRELPQDMARYRIEKVRMVNALKGKVSETEKEKPAWWTSSTTDSKKGMRMVIGFRNGGCEYWTKAKDYIGCKNCFYGASCELNLQVTQKQILKQLNYVLKKINKKDFDVIEILNDGSFLNDNEFTVKQRGVIFKKFATLKNVKRITVESRPEFIQENRVLQLMEILRPEQKLEIGVGLETIDPFVRDFSINKDFSIRQVEERVKLVEKINQQVSKREGISLYCLVKPVYINEKEALKDALGFVEYAHRLSKKYHTSIKINLEPVVVSRGTILDILYHDLNEKRERRYTPLNYWSILEIVCRIRKKKIDTLVKIGGREDMDDFRSLPAIYNSFGMISQYDFMVYWAIQQYNKDKNIVKLLSLVSLAFEDPALKRWQKNIGVKQPCFLTTYKKNIKKIKAYQKTKTHQKIVKIIKNIFKALDEIEYGETSQQKAQIWAYALWQQEKVEREITDYASKIFKKFLRVSRLKVKFVELVEYKIELLRMQIIFEYQGKNYGMWTAIPTKTKVRLEDM